jgi:dipeptidyl-peptidase-4
LSTFLLTPRGVFALEEEQAGRRLTVERIFERGEFETESWGPTLWLAGGTTYTTLEDSATLEGVKDVVGHDPASGAREILVAGDRLRPEGAAEALKIADYQWSQDRRRLLLFTNTKRVWRQNTRGDYWVYDRREGTLRQLGGTAPASSLMFASFSPGGDRVAYVRDNDLFVQHLGNMRIRRVTTDGGPDRINGTSDWVNEEELGLRQAYRWSPDGRWLAYWQFDTSGVSRFQLIDNTQGLYPAITSFPYPKVGQTNSACRVGVVRARGGRTRWIRTEGNPRDHYIAGLEWTPDSRRLVLQQLNRLQNTNRVWVGEVGTGRARVVHTDSDEAWVEAQERWQWLEEGRAFLWLSEREGWRHLYAVPVDGSEPRRLTSGEWDVIGLAGMDEEHGWVYVIASPDNPTQRYLYRVPLGGEGGPERVTPEDQAGTHTYELAEGARWAIRTVSRFGVPPVTDLVHLPEHESVRVLAEHAELHAKLGGLEPCDREFFRVGVGEGLELDGWCIKPPKFDPKGKYPLLVYVYGEPAGQTVLDRWGGNTYLWHWMLAQHGYVVVSVDNRGTPAPRGRSWRKAIYRQVGILAPGEQAAAVRQLLATRPYLDPDRVGVWGWSGGGSMSLNAIFRYPELYRAAVAVAFVSDQRLYDTIYQERYMGLPEDNENGYRDGSPIHHAHRLEGDLLLIHGTADDNCHYQHCEVLINELVKRHKAFSLLAYPNRTHGITEGDGTRRHLYESMTRFLQEHLRPSP